MIVLMVEYLVEDFAGWKTVFDGDPMDRASHGATGHRLLQDPGDPNHLMLSMDFTSREQADAFLAELQPVWDVSGAGQAWNPAGGGIDSVLTRLRRG